MTFSMIDHSEITRLMITTLPLHPNDLEEDKFHDECGVFGVFGHKDAAAHTAWVFIPFNTVVRNLLE